MLPVKANDLSTLKTERKSIPVVVSGVDNFNPKLLGKLSSILAELISGVAVLSVDNKIAISSLHDKVNASNLAKKLSVELSCKGGGSPTAAQLGSSEPIDKTLLTEKVFTFIDEL